MTAVEVEPSESDWEAIEGDVGTLHLPRQFCPVDPTAKQEWFLRTEELEAFFGGAAGPGKSWALLMAALMYVDVEGYDALLLRPTLTEFEKPGGLIEISHDWLGGTDAWWHGGKRQWSFPSGATLTFGYLSHIGNVSLYKGTAYSFCGFDELTSFGEQLYRAMFRVLRQPSHDQAPQLKHIPIRMRSASNPGDVGHAWVKSRFVDKKTRDKDAVYVPAFIQDNPFLDYTEYLKSLAHLSPVDRERLIRGDWDVMEEGGKFSRDGFIQVEPGAQPAAVSAVRYWDLAATEPSPSQPDPDYTVGLLLERDVDGKFTVADIVRGQWSSEDVETVVRETAERDGRAVTVYIEQEPGASGKSLISHFQRKVLHGFSCYRGLPRGDKEVRSRPVAAAVANGNVRLVRGRNHREFLDEASIFPNGAHDDTVDALSGAHTKLTGQGSGRVSVSRPRGRLPGVETSAAIR